MTRSVTVILGPRPMSHREEVTYAPSQRGSIVDEDVHGDGMVRRHAGQARIVHASTCYIRSLVVSVELVVRHRVYMYMLLFAPRG